MKRALLILLTLTSVLAAPTPLVAQGKIRIAIWDFENHAPTSSWFWDKLGPAARDQIDSSMFENKTIAEKFSVVEREKIALVMKEQGLSSAGALDPQTAAKVGRILGVKYIVTGGIDKFVINTTRGGIGGLGIGGRMTTADATINVRFIDTTTAERVIAVSADGQVKKGGGSIRGTGLERDAEWGIASETIQKASKAVVDKLMCQLGTLSAAAGPASGIDMRVIKVDGSKAFINVGSSSGIKVGDTFKIFSLGEELIDPVTGAKLGSTEKETGTAVVSEVQERFAIVTVTGTAAPKSVLRKP